MRFAFIDRMKKAFPIEVLCRVLKVTSRGLRAWRSRPMSQRQRDDMILFRPIQFNSENAVFGRDCKAANFIYCISQLRYKAGKGDPPQIQNILKVQM